MSAFVARPAWGEVGDKPQAGATGSQGKQWGAQAEGRASFLVHSSKTAASVGSGRGAGAGWALVLKGSQHMAIQIVGMC